MYYWLYSLISVRLSLRVLALLLVATVLAFVLLLTVTGLHSCLVTCIYVPGPPYRAGRNQRDSFHTKRTHGVLLFPFVCRGVTFFF